MNYKYVLKDNFEDYASGRVIYHKSNIPAFPVRLAAEIFSRCMHYLNKDKEISLYDPCCGGGYLLTVLGFIYYEKIKEIFASDINDEVLEFAKDNLSLLNELNLIRRKKQIEKMFEDFKKKSHEGALKSIDKFLKIIRNKKYNITASCFKADILNRETLKNQDFISDIVIADVPYGNMVGWSEDKSNPIDIILDTIKEVITENSIVAVSHNKIQKIKNKDYIFLEKFKAGKRQINILKLKEGLG